MRETMMRKLLCALFALGVASTAPAQDYPSKPIRIVVPLAPGGGTDTLARRSCEPRPIWSSRLKRRAARWHCSARLMTSARPTSRGKT